MFTDSETLMKCSGTSGSSGKIKTFQCDVALAESEKYNGNFYLTVYIIPVNFNEDMTLFTKHPTVINIVDGCECVGWAFILECCAYGGRGMFFKMECHTLDEKIFYRTKRLAETKSSELTVTPDGCFLAFI